MSALDATAGADSRVDAMRLSAEPSPGERYLDTRGRTIEVLAVRWHARELVEISVRIPIYSGGGRTQHWRPTKWHEEIAVGPLVEADAA